MSERPVTVDVSIQAERVADSMALVHASRTMPPWIQIDDWPISVTLFDCTAENLQSIIDRLIDMHGSIVRNETAGCGVFR